ncbi:MAG: lipoyl(octanoyl) transferase LipB [Gammaproteobacteria bacterium]
MPTTPAKSPNDPEGNILDRTLRVLYCGETAYDPVWKQMQTFTAARDESSQDELWLLQHSPVFTIGLNGSSKHLLDPGKIPVIHVDRGGQVTYHGPGQLVAYVLIDLARHRLGVVDLVRFLEQSVIDLLTDYGIAGNTKSGAPGVYVAGSKLAAVGLRVKKACCYHGLAINVNMDLEPFSRINPCGYPGLPVTQLCDLGITADTLEIRAGLESHLVRRLGYTVAK